MLALLSAGSLCRLLVEGLCLVPLDNRTDGRTDGRTEQSPSHKKLRFKGDVGVVSAAMRDVRLSKPPGEGVIAGDMEDRIDSLKAPFPWFGGKSRASELIWRRLGDVGTYNEPFAGSLAVLLSRPHLPRVETVNDLDCYLANFWRALQADPEMVAYYADYPVNETDLHARHQWLVNQAEFQAAMKADPEYFDAKIAGWWVWGQCLWIGSGWCHRPEWTGRGVGAAANRGVHNQAMSGTEQKRPKLRERGADGVTYGERRWQGGGQGGGSGVHAPRFQNKHANGADVERIVEWNCRPDLSAANGRGGVLTESAGLYDYLSALSQRLRRVRVCCGDWSRVLTPSVTTYVGLCGVLLDPPYSHDLRERCYSEDHDISADVRTWAIANGDNPEFRIALCGYEDEHGPHMPDTWEKVEWKAHGGYSRTERGKANREQERVWFSPHCLTGELPLFAEPLRTGGSW